MAIKKSEWRPNAKHSVIVFTDAPAKPEMHSSTVESGEDKTVGNILHSFANDRLSMLYIYAPKENNPIVGELEMIPRSKIYYVDEHGDKYEGLKNLDFQKVLEDLAKTISGSSTA